MGAELRKRLEVLTEKACRCMDCSISECRANRIACHRYINFRKGAIGGAELGYKEAIAVAKEWMKENARHYSNTVIGRKAMIYDFTTDMKKLWEEKK